jgi:hypothetical protein
MFERYSEKEPRVIFFARYEASNYGSTEIDTEHLVAGNPARGCPCQKDASYAASRLRLFVFGGLRLPN